MVEMSGLRISVLLLFILYSCNNLHYSKNVSKVACDGFGNSSDSGFIIKKKEDFENLNVTLFLVCQNDTIDSFYFPDCYGEEGKIEVVNDSLFSYTYQVRGGIGIKRIQKSFLYEKNNKLEVLFSKITEERISDSLFSIPTYSRNCLIFFETDSITMIEKIIQDNQLVDSTKRKFSLFDLKRKKITVPDYLIDNG